MGKGDGVNVLRSHWDGIDAVLAELDKPHPSDSKESSRDNLRSDGWDLSLGYDGADAAYRGGWAEGAQRAYDLAETLNPRPMSSRTALRRSVTGAFPNVGAYLAGRPDSMYAVSKRQAAGRPYVHLYMPIGYSASVKADTVFERGCALVALTDALETAGCRLRITAIDASLVGRQSVKTKYVGLYELKDYGDDLDVDSLIFTVAHPAFFRRLVFAIRERSPYDQVRARTHNGYGESCEITDDDIPGDGRSVVVRFPRLKYGDTGTAAIFLAAMVGALPETLQTTIKGGE